LIKIILEMIKIEFEFYFQKFLDLGETFNLTECGPHRSTPKNRQNPTSATPNIGIILSKYLEIHVGVVEKIKKKKLKKLPLKNKDLKNRYSFSLWVYNLHE